MVALVADKIQQSVLDDRTTHLRSETLLSERVLGRGAPQLRVQRVVLKVPGHAALGLVGARARHGVDHAVLCGAELHRKLAGQHAELLNPVLNQLNGHASHRRGLHRGAVHLKSRAVRRTVANRDVAGRYGDAWRQRGQLGEIARKAREPVHFLGAHDPSQDVRFSLDDRTSAVTSTVSLSPPSFSVKSTTTV